MNYGFVNQDQLENIDKALKKDLIDIGVECVMLIDMAGNTIAKCDNGKCTVDTYAFAALAAGNYATVDAMAKLVGETEFSLLFHKGEKASIHFSKVNNDLLLITMFNRELSLGFLRLKVVELIEKIRNICGQSKNDNT
ncbi:MAG: roadblock/LC7 domain-containing protein [Thermodesulfobacteriota bacterium]|nr:roadblock/LC7 domain-containing protein [Thermodesulfobacteriota bacterium]